MATVRPQFGASRAQPTMSTPTMCNCAPLNSSALSSSSLDGRVRENSSANFQAASISVNFAGSTARVAGSRFSVSQRAYEPRDSRNVRRPCGCECECVRASLHLNFQLPSRSFAGFERVLVGGGMSCEPSDLECKSASYNPQFEAERVRKQQQQQDSHPSLGFYLHDLMDQAGIETTHARAARAGFMEEVAKMQKEALTTESTELVMMDVARAALEISAEDDALVSHSSVPLPVDSYLERLDSMATDFGGHHLPADSPRMFDALENYLWNYKGFRITKAKTSRDARDFYLNGVLTRRQGPPLMLGLIYSEVVKRLWRSGTIDFLVDMNMPGDDFSFPLPIYKKRFRPPGTFINDQRTSTEENCAPTGRSGANFKYLNQNLLTPKNVLMEVLRSLKKLYWPWRSMPGLGAESDFLEAATAANRGIVTSASSFHGPFESLFSAPSSERGSEVARARAAQYRLQRGIWTSTTFGDLRRALAASERLVTLGGDKQEHRDYGMLLFHAGLYKQAFQYLSSYASREVPAPVLVVFNAKNAQVEAKEAVALDHLLERLSLILTERSWNISSDPPLPIVSPPDPW